VIVCRDGFGQALETPRPVDYRSDFVLPATSSALATLSVPFVMSTPLSSILLFVVAALAGALGQFLYKSGADQATGGWTTYVFNVRLVGGVACYIAVMMLFVAAFKRGGSLTVLYPVYASTFIWAAVIAWYAYGIPIKPLNVAGMLCLIIGMYLLGK
jgi:hypothetical protein